MQEPKPDRTLYEIATSFFAGVVIVFALGGMIAVALGDEGLASAPFMICTAFLALGLGRLYLGLRRGAEGTADRETAAPAAAPESRPKPRRPGTPRPRPRRRG